MPIFELKFTFLKVLTLYMVKHPEMVMTLQFFLYILILRGPNIEQFTHEIVMQWQIAIWYQTVPSINELKKQTPIFFQKNWGLFP